MGFPGVRGCGLVTTGAKCALICGLLVTAIAGAKAEYPEDAAKAHEWWSLKRLKAPAVPEAGTRITRPSETAKNPIDAFIEAKLAEKGLRPSPEADARTLVRRVFFDLHGLPPTMDDVEKLWTQGWPELVDRLLASPHYGERWARHWLDTIHYADSHGFEHDVMRTNAWRFRDYVIGSLNRDTPWGTFVREQLAADVFYSEEPALTVALGFLGA